jgi:uncharacterized CHY-type Zn-finger protein
MGLKGSRVHERFRKSFYFRYIKTIALQIEITKYFQACLTCSEGESASTAMSKMGSSRVPTLFGSQQVRNELVIMVSH